MLLALQNAIVELLKSALPALFTGDGAASPQFLASSWQVDPVSADPVAGEPGPDDAVDQLALDAAAPAGPHTLTRPPYPGPRRVYLRSAQGELVALAGGEVVWSPLDPATFTLALRPDRLLASFGQLEVHYGVLASATRVKTLHDFTLQITAPQAADAERAQSLALSALILNRAALVERGSFSFSSGGYGAAATLKSLSIRYGGAPEAASRTLALRAELELRLERTLAETEGAPIAHIVSPSRAASGKAIDLDPAVVA